MALVGDRDTSGQVLGLGRNPPTTCFDNLEDARRSGFAWLALDRTLSEQIISRTQSKAARHKRLEEFDRLSGRDPTRRRNACRCPAQARPKPLPATIPLNRPLHVPDALGRFGSFGGRFVPETLMDALNQLAEAYEEAKADPEFQARLDYYLKHYVGRPSPLFHAERLTKIGGGATIYLKREDLNHTGAHKINNAIGQVMLAQRMGKTRVIAETGAGQHGVATATACALFGIECTVYMGEEDIRRQKLNVFNMKTLGANVVPVDDRLEDPPRRHQRGDARLDGLVADDPLHDRQRGRPASVPDDRPRLPGGDRPRGRGAVPRPARPAARRGRGLRRRRLERGRDVLPVHRGRRRSS